MGERILSVLATAAMVVVTGAAVATAATRQEIEVTTTKTAWYAQAPPCAAIDCSILPLVHPYPEDTLHVSISGGQETARTYLAFPTSLPTDGRLIGGTLELPLDEDPANGSVAPDTADFVACLTATKFEPVRGSFATPPKARCDVRKPARYDEKEVLYTVGLGTFVDSWKRDEAALALVPSEAAVERGDTWHVVFPAGGEQSDAPAEDQPEKEIVATLEYLGDAPTVPDEIVFDPGTDPSTSVSGDAGDFQTSTGPSFDSGTGFTAAQPSTDVPEATTPVQQSEGQTAPVASFIEGFAGPGFAYPIIWALPLLLLVGLGAVGRALTKDLYRRGV